MRRVRYQTKGAISFCAGAWRLFSKGLGMWCRACQQEVPGISSPQDGTVRCARCHSQYTVRLDPAATLAPPHATSKELRADVNVTSAGTFNSASTSPTFFQCWELDENLRSAEQIARNLRFHTRHARSLPKAEATATGAVRESDRSSEPTAIGGGNRMLRFASRTLLGSSFVLFSAGAILAGWSMAVGNALLWRFAMPLVLTGEAGLVLSLVTHLLAESQRDRAAGEVLVQLDRQVRRLRDTATNSESPSGASPHLVLADLKAQLEILSQQLRDEE
jgi:hypothetical protein